MKIIQVLLILVISTGANAGQWIVDENPADIIEMGGQNMGYPKGIFFVNNNNFPNPDNCKYSQFVHFSEDYLIDRVLSAALYTQSSGRKMAYYINGCNGDYIHAHAFQIVD